MINHLRLQQNIEDEYETQLLNEFYNQEDIHWEPILNYNKKEKLIKIKNKYHQTKSIINKIIKRKTYD